MWGGAAISGRYTLVVEGGLAVFRLLVLAFRCSEWTFRFVSELSIFVVGIDRSFSFLDFRFSLFGLDRSFSFLNFRFSWFGIDRFLFVLELSISVVRNRQIGRAHV